MTHSISKAITARSLGDNPQTPTRNRGDRSELELRGAATTHSLPATEILLVQLPAWRAGVWFVFFVLVLAVGLPPRTGDRHAAIGVSRRVLAWMTLVAGILMLHTHGPFQELFAAVTAAGVLMVCRDGLASALRQFLPRRAELNRRIRRDEELDRPSGRTSRVISTLLLWGVAMSGTVVNSAEPIARVYVPIDDQLRPVSNYYFVERSFYKALLRRAASDQRTWESYPVRARYFGRLELKGRQGRLPRLIAEYRLFQLNPDREELRLVFPRDTVPHLSPTVECDGEPCKWRYDDDARAIVVPCRPGSTHYLRFGLEFSEETNVSKGLILSLPRIADAVLQLSGPTDWGHGLRVEGARGVVRRQEDPLRWTISLGPTARILLHGPDGQSDTVTSSPIREIIYWQPGATKSLVE
ncbi:MAG TPA: hypothetical protein VIY86_04925, partial [Pirellulaceae bacterium]